MPDAVNSELFFWDASAQKRLLLAPINPFHRLPILKLDIYSYIRLGLPFPVASSVVASEILYAFLTFSIRAACVGSRHPSWFDRLKILWN
jgi:hypothetical protein